MPLPLIVELATQPNADTPDKLLPGMSGVVKVKIKPGRPNWRWGQIARELHCLWEASCDPAQPITLPEDAAKAAVYIAAWMGSEW